MPFLAIYITNPDEATAKQVSQHLLDKKLIACANIHPVSSMYWWEGTPEHTTEYVALVKTTVAQWEAVQQVVKAIHPYKVPCIMKMQVEANPEYEQWIKDQVTLINHD